MMYEMKNEFKPDKNYPLKIFFLFIKYWFPTKNIKRIKSAVKAYFTFLMIHRLFDIYPLIQEIAVHSCQFL